MVFIVEALDDAFLKGFWEFIEAGGSNPFGPTTFLPLIEPFATTVQATAYESLEK
jgi:hypothetical protein